jgi:hypothetical protein
VAARSKAWTIFVRSNAGIVGSNPIQGMRVCVHLFCAKTYKFSINPITNPNPVYSYSFMWQYLFLQIFLFAYIFWMSTKQLCITFAKRIHAYTHTQIYICDYLSIGEFEYLFWWRGWDRMLYEVCSSSSNRGLHVTVHSSSPLLLFRHIVQCGNWSMWPRRTGRFGMLSEFWLPMKGSSVLLMFVRGGARIMYILR